ncbi:MAG: SDR family oxidoreductase [Cyanobacteria bacterium P01_A01_bin.123]
MAESKTVFLAGASRGVGRAIANLLSIQHYRVHALLRQPNAQFDLEALGIQVHFGDALDSDAVHRAVAASAPVDAVISTVGGLPRDGGGDRADYLGNKHLIDAAVATHAGRFILISSIGAGESAPALPAQAMAVLGPVLAEKEKAEAHLIASGLTYTVIRPGGLLSAPTTGQGLLTEDPTVSGSIHRADVAQLVCECLKNAETCDKVFSAVDRQLIRSN